MSTENSVNTIPTLSTMISKIDTVNNSLLSSNINKLVSSLDIISEDKNSTQTKEISEDIMDYLLYKSLEKNINNKEKYTNNIVIISNNYFNNPIKSELNGVENKRIFIPYLYQGKWSLIIIENILNILNENNVNNKEKNEIPFIRIMLSELFYFKLDPFISFALNKIKVFIINYYGMPDIDENNIKKYINNLIYYYDDKDNSGELIYNVLNEIINIDENTNSNYLDVIFKFNSNISNVNYNGIRLNETNDDNNNTNNIYQINDSISLNNSTAIINNKNKIISHVFIQSGLSTEDKDINYNGLLQSGTFNNAIYEEVNDTIDENIYKNSSSKKNNKSQATNPTTIKDNKNINNIDSVCGINESTSANNFISNTNEYSPLKPKLLIYNNNDSINTINNNNNINSSSIINCITPKKSNEKLIESKDEPLEQRKLLLDNRTSSVDSRYDDKKSISKYESKYRWSSKRALERNKRNKLNGHNNTIYKNSSSIGLAYSYEKDGLYNSNSRNTGYNRWNYYRWSKSKEKRGLSSNKDDCDDDDNNKNNKINNNNNNKDNENNENNDALITNNDDCIVEASIETSKMNLKGNDNYIKIENNEGTNSECSDNENDDKKKELKEIINMKKMNFKIGNHINNGDIRENLFFTKDNDKNIDNSHTNRLKEKPNNKKNDIKKRNTNKIEGNETNLVINITRNDVNIQNNNIKSNKLIKDTNNKKVINKKNNNTINNNSNKKNYNIDVYNNLKSKPIKTIIKEDSKKFEDSDRLRNRNKINNKIEVEIDISESDSTKDNRKSEDCTNYFIKQINETNSDDLGNNTNIIKENNNIILKENNHLNSSTTIIDKAKNEIKVNTKSENVNSNKEKKEVKQENKKIVKDNKPRKINIKQNFNNNKPIIIDLTNKVKNKKLIQSKTNSNINDNQRNENTNNLKMNNQNINSNHVKVKTDNPQLNSKIISKNNPVTKDNTSKPDVLFKKNNQNSCEISTNKPNENIINPISDQNTKKLKDENKGIGIKRSLSYTNDSIKAENYNSKMLKLFPLKNNENELIYERKSISYNKYNNKLEDFSMIPNDELKENDLILLKVINMKKNKYLKENNNNFNNKTPYKPLLNSNDKQKYRLNLTIKTEINLMDNSNYNDEYLNKQEFNDINSFIIQKPIINKERKKQLINNTHYVPYLKEKERMNVITKKNNNLNGNKDEDLFYDSKTNKLSEYLKFQVKNNNKSQRNNYYEIEGLSNTDERYTTYQRWDKNKL